MTENKATLVINAIVNKENIAELQDYLSAMGPIIKKNGGVPVGKYKATTQLSGDQGPEMVSIVQFPSSEIIKTMINGEEFKILAEIRARVFSKLNLTICTEM